MITQFDHRYGDYALASNREGRDFRELPHVAESTLADAKYVPLPRYWVAAKAVEAVVGAREWLIGWRDITNVTNERTVIATILPRAGVGHNMPLILSEHTALEMSCLMANFNSFILDYAARQKLGGTHLTYFVLKQLPVMPPSAYVKVSAQPEQIWTEWMGIRVLELVYSSWDIEPFARDMEYSGAPVAFNNERRLLLRAELDAAFFYLYGFQREDVDYVMDTFWVVRDRDVRAYGEYRTKRLILEIYDELAEAIASGRRYQTRLHPPPADPRVAHPPKGVTAVA
jgi:hypothetical protein